MIVGLFCAGALAASMSSGDALLHTAAAVAVRDGYVTGLGRPLDPHTERHYIRWTIVAVVICAYTLAITYQGSLAMLLVFAYGPMAQFFPVLIATLYWRRATGAGVVAGLVAGIATSLSVKLGLLDGHGLHEGLWGLGPNVLALISVSLVTRGEQEEDFLEVAGTPEAAVDPQA